MDVADGCCGKLVSVGDVGELARCQDDVGAFDGDVCPCTNGDANVCASEGWRVVDAVTDHGDDVFLRDEIGDDLLLLSGQDFGDDVVHTDTRCNGLSGGVVVTGEHDDAFAELLQGLDGAWGVGFDLIGTGDHAEHEGRICDVKRGFAVARELFCFFVGATHIEPEALHEREIAGVVGLASDGCCDAATRKGIEI